MGGVQMKSSLWLRAVAVCAALASPDTHAVAQAIPKPTIRDSSGVRIVEYATIKTTLPAFRVAPQFVGDVGGIRDDPKDEIEAKTGYETAVRFADGRIAVAENNTIRVLDSKGKFVRLLAGL